MTWKEFKQKVEEMGMEEASQIDYIEVHSNKFGAAYNKVDDNWLIEDLD
ncbi:unnamed protein product [marine sediment metagenome]|uniref:Uncharacterized protein n=1 Tax=marine sediment metagenome TaxID=412755 RepID=X1DP42_9ZZZZ